MIRILVTGSRNWTDYRKLSNEIGMYITEVCAMGFDSDGLPVDYDLSGVVIVHGGCKTGADSMAGEWAAVNWCNEEIHPADWMEYGKRAGYVRNQKMVDLGANVCLAFGVGNSKGASMTIGLAERAGIEVRRFDA